MVRIGVFTDEPMAAIGLNNFFSNDQDLLLVGVWDDSTGLTRWVTLAEPDVLLIDMAGALPTTRIQEIRRRAPSCKLVCWTRGLMFESAIHLVELGVQGIIPKTTTGHLLSSLLRKVASGEQFIDETLFAPTPVHTLRLTGREQQILSLVSLGMKNKEMASALSISEGTLKVYVSRLLQKTGMRDRHQLALYRLRNPDGAEFVPRNAPRQAEYMSAH